MFWHFINHNLSSKALQNEIVVLQILLHMSICTGELIPFLPHFAFFLTFIILVFLTRIPLKSCIQDLHKVQRPGEKSFFFTFCDLLDFFCKLIFSYSYP